MQNSYFAKAVLISSAVGVLVVMYIMQEFLIGSFVTNIACSVLLTLALVFFFARLNSYKKAQNKKD